MSIEETADERPQGHSQVQADIIGAVGQPPPARPGLENGGGLADGGHDPISAGHKESGKEHGKIVFHESKKQDSGKSADGTKEKKEGERQAVKQVFHTQAENEKDHGVKREKEADGNRKLAGLCVTDKKGLGGAVGNGEQHDDRRIGEDFRICQL